MIWTSLQVKETCRSSINGRCRIKFVIIMARILIQLDGRFVEMRMLMKVLKVNEYLKQDFAFDLQKEKLCTQNQDF